MQIAPITIWNNGTAKTATIFLMRIVHDDLSSNATLYYELLEAGQADAPDIALASGNLHIDGAEYLEWNCVPDINLWIYDWALTQLNLTTV